MSLLMCFASFAHALDQTQLESILTESKVKEDLPGLRAAVIRMDAPPISAAIGSADVANDFPMNSEIGMPGGSTGKTFVAALTMILVEEGVLSLNDPISKWVGHTEWFRDIDNHADIQVRHLLSHSSGISDYPGSVRFQSSMIWRVIRHGSAYFTPEELIEFASKRGAEFLPGEGFRYTDAGYLVLGRVLEAASKGSYYALLADKILLPQELSEIRPAIESALPDIAVGYQRGASVLRDDGRMKLDPRSEWTGGGLVLTPEALARFYHLLASGHIVSPQALQQMVNGGWRDDSRDWHYGYGLFVYPTEGFFEHGGRWPGYRTHVRHLPERRVTIAVQTNEDSGVDLPALVSRIQKAL